MAEIFKHAVILLHMKKGRKKIHTQQNAGKLKLTCIHTRIQTQSELKFISELVHMNPCPVFH